MKIYIDKLEELTSYCHKTVFDRAVGDAWQKTPYFIELIKGAEAELESIRALFKNFSIWLEDTEETPGEEHKETR